jgi:hypothetical protein
MPWDPNTDLPLPEVERDEGLGEFRITASLGGPTGKPYAVVRPDNTVVDWHARRDDAIFQIRSMMRAEREKREKIAARNKAQTYPTRHATSQPQRPKREPQSVAFTPSATAIW